jgi:hypothetical protein
MAGFKTAMPVQPSFSNRSSFPVEIDVTPVFPVMARLQDHVDFKAKRVQQFHEHLEEVLIRCRPHQDGHAGPRLLVVIDIVPVTLAGYDLQVVGRANRVGQREVAVANDAQVRFQFFFAQPLEAAGSAGRRCAVSKNIAKEFLQKPHVSPTPLRVLRPWKAGILGRRRGHETTLGHKMQAFDFFRRRLPFRPDRRPVPQGRNRWLDRRGRFRRTVWSEWPTPDRPPTSTRRANCGPQPQN